MFSHLMCPPDGMTELTVNGISGKTEQGRLIVEDCIGLGSFCSLRSPRGESHPQVEPKLEPKLELRKTKIQHTRGLCGGNNLAKMP